MVEAVLDEAEVEALADALGKIQYDYELALGNYSDERNIKAALDRTAMSIVAAPLVDASKAWDTFLTVVRDRDALATVIMLSLKGQFIASGPAAVALFGGDVDKDGKDMKKAYDKLVKHLSIEAQAEALAILMQLVGGKTGDKERSLDEAIADEKAALEESLGMAEIALVQREGLVERAKALLEAKQKALKEGRTWQPPKWDEAFGGGTVA